MALDLLALKFTVSNLVTVAVFLTISYVLYAVGRALVDLVGCSADSRLGRTVHAVALGYIVLFLSVAVLGALGAFRREALLVVLAGMLAAGAGRIHLEIKGSAAYLRGGIAALRGAEPYLVISAAFVGYLVLVAFNPPTAWDEVAYGLFLPAQYVLRNGLPYVEEYGPYSLFPAYGEMPAVAGILLGYEYEIPHLFTVASYAEVAAAAALVARRLGARRAVLPIVFVMTLALPAAIEVSPIVKNDLLLCLFEAMAFVSVLEWKQSRRLADIGLSGVYAGTALGIKYTAAVVLGALGLAVAVLALANRRELRRWYAHIIVFTAVVCLMFLPWGIRNGVLSGNPVFPLMTGILGGGGAWAFLPLHAEIMAEMNFRITDWSWGSSDSLGPWLRVVAANVGLAAYVNLPVFAWLYRREVSELGTGVAVAFWTAVTLLIVWVGFFFWEPRYVLFLQVLLIAMVGLTLQRLALAAPWQGLIVSAVVLSQTLLAWTFMVDRHPHPGDFFSYPGKTAVLRHRVKYGDVAWYLNRNTPPGSRIATNTQPFWYLDRPIVHLHGHSEYGHFQLLSTAEEFIARLKALDVAYVAWGDHVYPRYRWREDAYAFWGFVDRVSQFVRQLEEGGGLRLLAEVQGVRIYAVEN